MALDLAPPPVDTGLAILESGDLETPGPVGHPVKQTNNKRWNPSNQDVNISRPEAYSLHIYLYMYNKYVFLHKCHGVYLYMHTHVTCMIYTRVDTDVYTQIKCVLYTCIGVCVCR